MFRTTTPALFDASLCISHNPNKFRDDKKMMRRGLFMMSGGVASVTQRFSTLNAHDD
jgi:hypothetical protein